MPAWAAGCVQLRAAGSGGLSPAGASSLGLEKWKMLQCFRATHAELHFTARVFLSFVSNPIRLELPLGFAWVEV